ncbi:DUF3500 domain-containing protein [Emticicia agri]|uniref:DUF3500 domain-containing protein n=1 Tax=Emticicia agri TaxID=2492393 RepID=A0A4Q5LTS6_9BACT|nr:DUF3500 domain-containing protein [Emticicia agri]RYU93056.1 DUF3500 domain-containing protein [Emticicia agri]
MKTNRLYWLGFLLIPMLIFQSCEPDEIVTLPLVSGLNCSTATISATPMNGVAFSGRATIGYTGGNGMAYSSTDSIASNGVAGLKAHLVAGILSHGEGTIAYTITGRPNATGKATFPISFGGQTCNLEVSVSVDTTTPKPSTASVDRVLAAIDTFRTTLSAAQRTALQLPYTKANAMNWTVQAGNVTRNGLSFNTLTETQIIAAKKVIAAATGTTPDEGYGEFTQILMAEDVLAANSEGNYSSKYYNIALIGTPDLTSTWTLQFGGHNYIQHITYSNGAVVGVTPSFQAVEPRTWLQATVAYAPLDNEKNGMAAMLAGLTTEQLTAAKLTTAFTEVSLGAGKDGQFPTRAGIPVSSLTASQKALVLAAIKPWTLDADDVTGMAMLAIYEKELDNTYISYTGNATLSQSGDYVRIDGPSVWIEFLVRPGVVNPAEVQYRSVYRDRKRDYGGM